MRVGRRGSRATAGGAAGRALIAAVTLLPACGEPPPATESETETETATAPLVQFAPDGGGPACARGTLTVAATPAASGPLPAHATAVYDVRVANDDGPGCPPL